MNRKHIAITALIAFLIGAIVVGIYNHYSSSSKEVNITAGKTLVLTCDGFENDVGQIVVPTQLAGIPEVNKAKFGCKVVDAANKVASK